MIKQLWDRLYKGIGKILYKFPRVRYYMPDKMYLQCRWRERLPDYGELNLDAPETANEKYNWMKLYYHNPLLHKLVDKYEVKEFVAKKIGSQYVTKTIGLYNSVNDIDFKQLPNQFVLKCTHDSGSIVICDKKENFNIDEAKRKLSSGLAVTDYYKRNREWAYKGVKPRIIAEEYIKSLNKPDSIEYKLICIYGKVKMITVCSGIAHVEYSKRFNDHFDRNFNRLPFYVNYKPAGQDLQPSKNIEKMIELAETLSQDLPHVRVDFYIHNDQIFFGEMTFYTWGGFNNFSSREWDLKLGKWMDLPPKLV